MLILAKDSHTKTIGNLSLLLCLFDKLEIPPFNRNVSFELTNYFIENFDVKVTKEISFKKGVFCYSRGNPGIIKSLCLLARDRRYQKEGFTDVKLLDLDRRISEAAQ